MANLQKLNPAEARAALAALDQLYAYYMPVRRHPDGRVIPYLTYGLTG